MCIVHFFFARRGGAPHAYCSFLFRTAEKETNQRKRPPADAAKLKFTQFFLKRPNALRFAPVERCPLLHGKITQISSRFSAEGRNYISSCIGRGRSFHSVIVHFLGTIGKTICPAKRRHGQQSHDNKATDNPRPIHGQRSGLQRRGVKKIGLFFREEADTVQPERSGGRLAALGKIA